MPLSYSSFPCLDITALTPLSLSLFLLTKVVTSYLSAHHTFLFVSEHSVASAAASSPAGGQLCDPALTLLFSYKNYLTYGALGVVW